MKAANVRPSIVVVTRETRLQNLRARWGTARQAKFLLRQAHLHEAERRPVAKRAAGRGGASPVATVSEDAEFSMYEQEDETYQRTLAQLGKDLDFGLPVKFLDRSFVPNYDFWNCQAVVVVGQDGLVANTAKYVGDAPIVAINPDPTRFDGVLLPFRVAEARRVVGQVLENRFRHRPVTLAEVSLNDGQTMLAFNDFFVGAASHVSARYILEVAGKNEPQSSSGLLVSTGAGSTGWLSSVFNMAVGVAHFLGTDAAGRIQLDWEDPRLVWAVREPFISKHSRAELIAGLLDQSAELTIESVMPSGGVIFSDGIESDFLPFNTGTIARIAAAKQRARIVVG
jgi:NAD kinase